MAREYFLSTEQLNFGRWLQDDLPLALALWGDPLVSRFVGGPFSQEHIQDRLNQEIACMDEYAYQYWPIFLRANDEFVGCCGMRAYKPEENLPAFGFYLRPPFWGRGFATEAGRGAIDYAFESLGIKTVFAGRDPQNFGSHRALEKLGFRYTHDQLYPPTGLMHPCYLVNRPTQAEAASS